jgi:hypothetical protein
MPVFAAVVSVIGRVVVIVVVLVNVIATVNVIARRHESMSLVSIATMRSRSCIAAS